MAWTEGGKKGDTWEGKAGEAVQFDDSSDFKSPVYAYCPMRSLPGFASESNLNAHSLDIHLHDSAMGNAWWSSNSLFRNTQTLSIWPCRASNFDSSDPMMYTVLMPASGPNSASSTYFRSLHSPRIPSGKPNWSKIYEQLSFRTKFAEIELPKLQVEIEEPLRELVCCC